MENTIEDQKSTTSYASNRGTISMFKRVKTAKKLSFTPTQASETSELYYDLDDKSIISFDNMVKKNECIKFESEIRRSSPEKTNNCIDLYDEYSDLIKSIKHYTRKKSCTFSTFQCRTSKGLINLSDKSNSAIKKKKSCNFSMITTLPNKEKEDNKNEDFQKMTNIQEIHDFHKYTSNCMDIIAKMEMPDESSLTKQFVTLPFAEDIGNDGNKKRLAIFDLDETLTHCKLKNIESAQRKVKIKISASIERTVGLNIRPNYEETIKKIKEKYHVVMFTASLQKYADAIMAEIDPKGELFEYRLYRNNCTQIKVDDQLYYIKDLRVFKNIPLEHIVIIDNSVLSFGFHLDNGIPILPYYSGEDEKTEMNNLKELLDILADVPSIPNKLRNLIHLHRYIDKINKEHLEPIEESENINGSFIGQNS